MPERPLLLFPTPERASRSTLHGRAGNMRRPSPQRQWDRLSPIFSQLQAVFENRRIEVQQTATGIDPDQVLVIETVGSVEAFANAVKRIEGFEWMGEIEIEEISPDEDFYNESNIEQGLSGRLYFVMTNLRALNEMLSLWQRYTTNPDMEFEFGFKKFRDVFLNLKNIRRWDVQDRLMETGLLQIWQEDLDADSDSDSDRIISFEAELWFRGSSELRTSSANQVTEIVRRAGGRILSQSVIEGIEYHGLLAELPSFAIQSIIDNPTTELVRCENVMFFRPVGQMIVGDRLPEGEAEMMTVEESSLPTGEPVIALFDGIPLSNHGLLLGRVLVDDPDGWSEDSAPSERFHGTSMASLIVHGDLNQQTAPLSRPIYIRPIMKPHDWFTSPRPESIPETCLTVDLIHRAVKRLFEGDQGELPVAPQVKVINLSVGDRTRQFTQTMSPVARLLDWLSFKYSVLFVVSAGNHPVDISLGISREEFDSLDPSELEAVIIQALYRGARHRKLLSPAETINGITVGAVHKDASDIEHPRGRFDPFEQLLPSPISAFGGGYRRSIKPEVVFDGGKQFYRLRFGQSDQVTIEPAIFRVPPGNKVASPGTQPGELTAISYSCGTSNATALISRSAGICYDLLQRIFDEQDSEVDLRLYDVPLLKAMLVHGCSWSQIGSQLRAQIERTDIGREIQERANTLYARPADISNEISRQYKSRLSRWMGYGFPEFDRVLDCTAQRAILLGFGELADGQAHLFSLPLPPGLSSRPEQRRFTVTLGWLSPINANTQKYRTASLWFETNNNALAPSRRDADWNAVKRGTIQHEVFEGQRAEPFIEGDAIQIKVNCRKDSGNIQNSIPYGLVVSLEVSEGVDIAIYDEIRTRITPSIRIQQSTDQR